MVHIFAHKFAASRSPFNKHASKVRTFFSLYFVFPKFLKFSFLGSKICTSDLPKKNKQKKGSPLILNCISRQLLINYSEGVFRSLSKSRIQILVPRKENFKYLQRNQNKD